MATTMLGEWYLPLNPSTPNFNCETIESESCATVKRGKNRKMIAMENDLNVMLIDLIDEYTNLWYWDAPHGDRNVPFL